MKFEIGDKVRSSNGEYTICRVSMEKERTIYYVTNDNDDVMNMVAFFEGSVEVVLIRRANKLERIILGLDNEI